MNLSLCNSLKVRSLKIFLVFQFAPHMDGSNADFAPHMEGSHADFAPHMEWRHSFRDPKIAKIAISANFQKNIFFKPTTS